MVEELSARREALLLGKRRLTKVEDQGDYEVAHVEHEADIGLVADGGEQGTW